jgi:hypothetical protein
MSKVPLSSYNAKACSTEMGKGGGDELLAERDAISGGLVDIRKAIEFWL